MEDNMNDIYLEAELNSEIYDNISEAIKYTILKQHYHKYDLVKLIMQLYQNDYSFISSDKNYRDEYKLLASYFEKKYHHNIVTLEMIKTILKSENQEEIINEINNIEKMLRTQNMDNTTDPSIFTNPFKEKRYDELMTKIEINPSLKYAVAIVYDKLKNPKRA